jgi:hypothetical protein
MPEEEKVKDAPQVIISMKDCCPSLSKPSIIL